MDTVKICKKCGRELPLDKFGINHNYTRSMCKECFNEGMREKRYQQRLSDGIETYHKDKSMKIQRKYKKPYHFRYCIGRNLVLILLQKMKCLCVYLTINLYGFLIMAG